MAANWWDDAPVVKSGIDGALAAEGITGARAAFVKSIYQQESGSGANTKTSNAGAVGGMQIIPATFNRMADKGWNIANPDHNMRSGVRYASLVYDKAGGNPALAGAGYYGGEGAIDKARKGVAVSDPRNPKAPNTLQYGQQVASRIKPAEEGDWWAGAPLVQPQAASKPATTPEIAAKPSTMDAIRQGAGNVAAGLVRGAGSLGAAILAPRDAIESLIARKMGAPELQTQDRRAGMDSALGSMGAETDSFGYGAGKLAGEIAGTAGAGGVVANGMVKAAPMVANAAPGVANFLTKAAPAVQSGGLSLGAGAPTNMLANLGLRTAGGGIAGAAATLAATGDIKEAGQGALIGGAIPGGVKIAGAVGKAAKYVGAGAAKHTLGMTTGAGAESVGMAYQAGKSGGTNFLDNMRGNVPMSDVLDSAKGALSQMRMDRSAQYKQGMAGVSADKTVIDFAPIDKAVASLKSMGNFKGQVINKNASGAVDEISDLVTQWKSLDPAEFHTPEGLDALKQAISDVRDTTQFGTAARKAADTAYNAVKGEITSQAPTYAKVMKDYSQASETLGEIERALSLGNKAAADTSMRKLQSLMRNNVNTNYGNRTGLAKQLEQSGAEILPAVAGQAMSSVTPRGLQGLSAGGIAGLGIANANPLALAALPMTSPRLVGELAYGLGAANRGVGKAGSAGVNRLAQLVRSGNSAPLTMNQFAPILSTAPVLAANQR